MYNQTNKPRSTLVKLKSPLLKYNSSLVNLISSLVNSKKIENYVHLRRKKHK